MRFATAVLALFAAISTFGAPVITSVTPSSGPAGGGTPVTITGTGFFHCQVCSPALQDVFFGGTPALSVNFVSETKIEAVAPPHPAGTVSVTVRQPDGNAIAPNAFTYSGDFFAGLEPILAPIFTPPVFGAHGSEFRTVAAVAHEGGAPRVLLFGLESPCVTVLPLYGPYDPQIIEPHGIPFELIPGCTEGPGRLFWVPAGQAERIAFNMRVRDVSRGDVSHGTEIPVVRMTEFTRETIVLLNVPLEARFRNTLRVYALQPTTVDIVVGTSHHSVVLQPGLTEFDPAYAMFSDFEIDPAVPQNVRVTVRPVTLITSPPTPTVPIWAFISVTNNVSQEITTITPD